MFSMMNYILKNVELKAGKKKQGYIHAQNKSEMKKLSMYKAQHTKKSNYEDCKAPTLAASSMTLFLKRSG